MNRFWLLLSLLLASCGKTTRDGAVSSASASATPSLAPQLLEGVELSSASGFDLAARPDGLQLLWASPQLQPGWLHRLELRPDGKPRGQPQRVAVPARTLGKLTDLDATFVGDHLAVAWLEQGSGEARAAATLIEGTGAPLLLDLGPAALVAEAARGNIAIAPQAERGRALVMWRGLETSCIAPSTAPCTNFTFKHVRVGVAEPTGLPLSVPVPCASHSVSLATSPGRFYYGVCTRHGTDPVTTMFSIQYDPEYARAEPLLKGCLPLGSVELAERPWLVGDCHGRRRAAQVPINDEKVEVEDIDALAIYCTPQHLELRQGRFKLKLTQPRADLEMVLPESFVPTGGRAGWTGSALVVVYPAGSRLEARTFACRAGKLQP